MLRTEEVTTTVMKMRVWQKTSSFTSSGFSGFDKKEITVPSDLFLQSKSENVIDLSTISRYLLDSETLRSIADYLDSMPEYVTKDQVDNRASKTFSLGH